MVSAKESDLRILLARGFGCGAHVGQKYGTQPYTAHLEAVFKLTLAYDLPEIVQVGAWLHDTLEDTATTYQDLQKLFVDDYGTEIANLVWAVTNDPNPAPGYKERTYKKIVAHGKDAVSLKLCDRIVNVRACVVNRVDHLLGKYRNDYPRFRDILYKEDHQLDSLWEGLVSHEYQGEFRTSVLDLGQLRHAKAKGINKFAAGIRMNLVMTCADQIIEYRATQGGEVLEYESAERFVGAVGEALKIDGNVYVNDSPFSTSIRVLEAADGSATRRSCA